MAGGSPATTLVLFITFIIACSMAKAAFDCRLGVSLNSGFNSQLSNEALRELCDSQCYTYIILIRQDITGGYERAQEGITYCQRKGVKVLLSFAGQQSAFPPESFAQLLWGLFLDPNAASIYKLDGIDFGFTNGSDDYYHKLALEIKTLTNEIILSASPGCAYPSPYFNSAINDGLFDVIWPKFYNDSRCDYSGGITGVVSAWSKWTESIPDSTKLLYGLATSPDGVKSGYMPPTVFKYNVLPNIRYTKQYVGAMLWNVDHAQVNNLYAPEIAKEVCDNTQDVNCRVVDGGSSLIS